MWNQLRPRRTKPHLGLKTRTKDTATASIGARSMILGLGTMSVDPGIMTTDQRKIVNLVNMTDIREAMSDIVGMTE